MHVHHKQRILLLQRFHFKINSGPIQITQVSTVTQDTKRSSHEGKRISST
jgi:hypothetical protein